jgi:hypothetical protein
MKYEIDFGWIGNEKVTVESWDFEKITEIHNFIQFMEEHGWAVDYEAVDDDLEEDEDTEEEEVIPTSLVSDNTL